MYKEEKRALREKWGIIDSYKNCNCFELKNELSRESKTRDFFSVSKDYSNMFSCEDKMEEIQKQMALKKCNQNK